MRYTLIAPLLCLGAAPPAASAASYDLTPFRVHGDTNVSLTAINDHGVAVGTYFPTDHPAGAGFVGRPGAVFTLPKVEHSILKSLGIPYPTGINNAGAVTGYYFYGNSYVFVWQNDRYVATGLGQGVPVYLGPFPPFIASNDDLSFDVYSGQGQYEPEAGTLKMQSQLMAGGFPLIASTNAKLQIAGDYYTTEGSLNTSAVFTGTTSTIQPVFPPKAVAAYGGWINDAGQVAGAYQTKTTFRGFVYTAGTFRTFAMPTAPISLTTQGIDEHGRVVGVYTDATNQYGFVFAHGTVTRIGSFAPGDTVHVAISKSGKQIAVSDTDAGGESRSYLATCSGTGC